MLPEQPSKESPITRSRLFTHLRVRLKIEALEVLALERLYKVVG